MMQMDDIHNQSKRRRPQEGAMRALLLFAGILCWANIAVAENCPNETAFRDSGWVVHDGSKFQQILKARLQEFLPQLGKDLVVDSEASYISDYSHDEHMIMWIVVLDRLSTDREEMWGDVSFAKTGPCAQSYTEVRWYDPDSRTKHIVCNPEFTCCLTTKVPLAYNTIF